jgi:hypothetical protein
MRLLKKTKVPLLLAILVLVVFWDLIRLPSGHIIAGNDLVSMVIQRWDFGLDSLRQGEFPLWNPYLFSGTPFLAKPQPAFFYPPVWLLMALPATQVAGLLYCLHFWLAGVGMYGWLRSEEADEMGALFGAVVFAFSGYFFVRLNGGHLGIVMTLAWLPAILWAYHRALKRGGLSGAILGGLPVALSFLAGNSASFLYVGLVLAVYALYCAWEAWQQAKAPLTGLKPLLFSGVVVLTGLGLAAVQLLPTMEFSRLSTRQEATYTFAASHSWPPSYLLTLLIPNFFGQPGKVGYWGDGIYGELIFYTGILPLFLILALGFRKGLRHRLVPLLLMLGGMGLLLALGQFGILHRLAYNFLPLFQVTRAPARAGFLFTFAVAALSGLLLTWLRQEPKEARPNLQGWTQGPFLWVVVSLTTLVVLTGFLLFALQRESNPQVGRLWHVANNSALFLFLFLLAVGLMHAWGTGRLNAHQGTLLAIGLVLLDLWGFGRSLIQPVAVEESAYWRIVAEITKANGKEGRVLPWGLSIFEQNKGMALGMESIFGYDPLELERYSRFITEIPDPRARAYDLLHARYLATAQEMAFPEEAGAPQLIGQQAGVWVYERPTALPAAWLVHRAEIHRDESILKRINDPDFDPQSVVLLEQEPACHLSEPAQLEEVQLFRRGNNRVEVKVRAASGGVLVLSEVFYPGWRAALDGESVPLLRANYTLRAVCVPAGEHRVTFSFTPASLRLGAGITLLCLLLVGWTGWRLFKPS